MVNLGNVQTNINLARTVATTVVAHSSSAVEKHMWIKDPIVKGFAERTGMTDLESIAGKTLNEISLRLEGVEDKFVKDTIYDELGSTKNGVLPDIGFHLALLDAYHTVKNNYSMLGGAVQKFFQYLKKEVNPSEAEHIVQKSSWSGMSQPFEKARKLEGLKEFCYKYQKRKPEITKYLYETYYLQGLSPETKTICKKISDEFGTKVFLEH